MLPFHRSLVLSVAFLAAGATLRNMVDSVTRNPPSADAPAAGRPDGYLGVSEAARLLGVNRVTVWRWIAAGRIPVWRAGPRTARIKKADLDRLLVPGRGDPLDGPAPRCEHVVHFYESDDFLVGAVAEYVGSALRSDGTAIVIATAEHRAAVERRLVADGRDVTALAVAGRYVALDAPEVLGSLMVDGAPDPGRFGEAIGRVVARACASGEPVHAFGEMVALLALEGKVDAALRLEDLWNELQRDHRFSLLCAYPINRLGGEAFARAMDDVCAAHARVVPGESYSALGGDAARDRAIAELQQKAATLEAESAQRARAERELRDFVESAAIPMHWVAVDGTILWANRAELDMLGYAPEEYIGRHIGAFHADGPTIEDMLRRLARGETLREYPARMRCKDGSVRDVLVDSSVLWEDGRFVHTRCFARDVTGLRRLERERERLLAREREARRAAEEQAAAHLSLNAALREVAEERDRALAAERAARAAVEALQRRTAFLASVSARLARSLDYTSTLDEIARLAVGEVADWCVVDLAATGADGRPWLRRVAGAHVDPAKAHLIDDLQARFVALDGAAEHTAVRVLRSGQTWFDPHVSPERLAAEARGPEHLALLRGLGFAAEIVVPLAVHGRVLGTITLVGAEGRSYDREDVALAEDMAHLCAMAVANAQAYAAAELARREAQRAAARTQRFQEITRQLSRSLESDEVLAAVARAAAQLLDSPVGAVFLLDEGNPTGDFRLVAADGIDEARAGDLRLPRYASLAGRAVDEGRTLVVDDARHTPGTALPRLLTGEAAGSEIAAPIVSGDRRLGVVKAFSPRVRRFGTDDAELLGVLAAAAAVALTNARLYRQARDAIKTRDEFLSAAAHDLKTPLTTIKGTAQLIRRHATNGQLDPGRLMDRMATLDAAATRASRQLDQLLDVTRLRIGQELELQRRPTDLVKVVRQAIDEQRQAGQPHEIRLETEEGELVGCWDAPRLERVVCNLLDNAVKYSPDGGEVLVRVARERAGDQDWAAVAVRDHGIGIPSGELGRIFDRFGRASNAPALAEGTGIGLSNVRQIVEQHGGTVAVEGEEGVGSTFTVRLPLAPP